MNDREVMKLVLEALEYDRKPLCMCFSGCSECDPANAPSLDEAIEALRTRLAAPEPEPVESAGLFTLAHLWAQEAYKKGLGMSCDIDGARGKFQQALKAYAAPPDAEARRHDAERLTAEIERLRAELEVKYNQGYDAGHDTGYSLGQWGTLHDEEREYQKSRSLVERWKRFFSWL